MIPLGKLHVSLRLFGSAFSIMAFWLFLMNWHCIIMVLQIIMIIETNYSINPKKAMWQINKNIDFEVIQTFTDRRLELDFTHVWMSYFIFKPQLPCLWSGKNVPPIRLLWMLNDINHPARNTGSVNVNFPSSVSFGPAWRREWNKGIILYFNFGIWNYKLDTNNSFFSPPHIQELVW